LYNGIVWQAYSGCLVPWQKDSCFQLSFDTVGCYELPCREFKAVGISTWKATLFSANLDNFGIVLPHHSVRSLSHCFYIHLVIDGLALTPVLYLLKRGVEWYVTEVHQFASFSLVQKMLCFGYLVLALSHWSRALWMGFSSLLNFRLRLSGCLISDLVIGMFLSYWFFFDLIFLKTINQLFAKLYYVFLYFCTVYTLVYG